MRSSSVDWRKLVGSRGRKRFFSFMLLDFCGVVCKVEGIASGTFCCYVCSGVIRRETTVLPSNGFNCLVYFFVLIVGRHEVADGT